MKKDQANILIIIVTWNKKKYVLELLDSLTNIDYSQQHYDIVVVDNASDDGTQAELRNKYPEIHLICNNKNLGGTGGFNTGLAYAFEQADNKYDYLWLLDNDVQVNKNALKNLVHILDSKKEIAIVGSTMMQMDYHWKINEMGAFVDRDKCTLELNYFKQEIPSYKNKILSDLLLEEVDLTKELPGCQDTIYVDYVAAASLLIRANIAKKAGLWDDFFIHFDDAEWCLRIAQGGNKVAVSAKSLIWHMSAETKVPDWILYYDNRNALNLLKKHGNKNSVINTKRRTLKKALYYTLLGKLDLAQLHFDAVDDYKAGIQGKKDIKLDPAYHSIESAIELINKQSIKKVLLPWTINLEKFDSLKQALENRLKSDNKFKVYYLTAPKNSKETFPITIQGAKEIVLADLIGLRYIKYILLHRKYDLMIQSDYQPFLPLFLVAPNILYLNYCTISLRKRVTLKAIKEALVKIFHRY